MRSGRSIRHFADQSGSFRSAPRRSSSVANAPSRMITGRCLRKLPNGSRMIVSHRARFTIILRRAFARGLVRYSIMLTAQTIKNQHSDIFTFLHGNREIGASHCHIPEEALLGSLVYVSDAAQLAEARRHKPAILIVPAKMSGWVDALMEADSCCFSVQSISMGMAVLLKYFDRKCHRFTQWGERHPTAVVHPDATIGERNFLGPHCVIGPRASIGNDCMIGAHAVIENDARIGERSVLHPQVFIGAGFQIGDD